jgi:hypothetical protein
MSSKEAILDASPCVQMLGFRARSQRETKEAGLRPTPGRIVGYSISTKQYFVYDPRAKPLPRSRDVVFRHWKRYTAPNADDEVILNLHFYRDFLEQPKPTEQQPPRNENSWRQTEELLESDSPLALPKPRQQS